MTKKVKQHDITDCGAACLVSVVAHYHLEVPIARVRQYAGTDRKGTNILGLLEAAKKLGFNARGVRGDMDCLTKIPKPAIVHFLVNKQLHHFVVLYKATKKHFIIMDPADGQMHRLSHENFKKQWTGVLVLLVPDERFETGNEKISVLRRFWFLLKPHKFILLQAFIGALVYTLLGFSTSIYIQKLTDFVFIGGNTNLLNLLSVLMLILLALQTAIASFKDIFLIKTGQLIDLRLILGYYKHLLKLPQQFFDTMQVGEIISRIGDAIKIRTFINGISLNLTVNLLIIFFSFVLMFSLYWQLALIMLLIIPFYTLIYLLVDRWNRNTERKVMETAADLESQLVESLNTIRTIKHFGLEEFMNFQTETRFIKLLQKGYHSALNHVFSVNSTTCISSLFTVILLWSGSYFVIQRDITPGELMSFYAILGYFTTPVSRLINANKEIQNALIAADRLFEIMDLEQEKAEQIVEMFKEPTGDIRFADVSFRYGTRVELFDKFNLVIPRERITAIIGESGSGKSTLVNLLQKIYPIQKGKICIGETDIRYVAASCLRNYIAVVPQQIHLFSGTVLDNIALGDMAPEMERILQLCSTLGLLEFIEALPQGFHTHLGENGALLSGGQKQRIAIARALYKDPRILILDEATSSLDSRAEHYIEKTLARLRAQQKTIILIAHRLSSVVRADKIVVLQNGKVAEEGTHEQLFCQKGVYFDQWQRQLPSVPLVGEGEIPN